jgi:ABC-type branched-subunit amino acid transport system ATPase component
VTAASLSVTGLAVAFGGVHALRDVSLDVAEGQICGLIGPNGSGKTTLLDAISGIITPSAGAIAVDGVDLAELHPDERIELGVVRSFQDCRLYPALTVTDTLLLIRDARRPVGVVSSTLRLPWERRAERTARSAVDEVIGAFGLERFRDHRIGHLSTGTRRVVDLASVVLADPRLLLLDEPTAGIAQREAEAFIPLLRQLHEVTGATVVLVEHDVPLVFDLCGTVVVMATGQVVTAGTPAAVKADPAAVAAYLGASEEALHVTGHTVRPGAEGS